jgi:hypothetical protein
VVAQEAENTIGRKQRRSTGDLLGDRSSTGGLSGGNVSTEVLAGGSLRPDWKYSSSSTGDFQEVVGGQLFCAYRHLRMYLENM